MTSVNQGNLASTLHGLLRADLYRYGGDLSPRARRRALWQEPGFRFTWYLRHMAHWGAHRRGPGLLPYLWYRVWYNHYRFRYGFDISPGTRIGPGLYLGHFNGVVISPHALVGANVNIGQGATIGAINRGPRQGAPTLGDRVWVGAHAILVGGITIGHDALIAPGAYVNFDVPAFAVVLGNPGKIVSDKGSADYISNTLPEGS